MDVKNIKCVDVKNLLPNQMVAGRRRLYRDVCRRRASDALQRHGLQILFAQCLQRVRQLPEGRSLSR